MPHYAIEMNDGTVAIMQTVVQPDGREPSPEECIAKWPTTEQAKVVSHRPINPADIPQDRTYRNAWTDRGGKIDHDMGKARDIHRDRLRAARAPQLAQLDVDYQRADEVKDETRKAQIVAAKQVLRDMPADPRIEAAATVDDLKELTLEVLTVVRIP